MQVSLGSRWVPLLGDAARYTLQDSVLRQLDTLAELRLLRQVCTRSAHSVSASSSGTPEACADLEDVAALDVGIVAAVPVPDVVLQPGCNDGA